jgi:hypothetical protein
VDAASRTRWFFSLTQKPPRLDSSVSSLTCLNFRDTEFVHRKDLQNLEFGDMRLFFGVSSQTSVTDFREYDASLQDTGLEAD